MIWRCKGWRGARSKGIDKRTNTQTNTFLPFTPQKQLVSLPYAILTQYPPLPPLTRRHRVYSNVEIRFLQSVGHPGGVRGREVRQTLGGCSGEDGAELPKVTGVMGVRDHGSDGS